MRKWIASIITLTIVVGVIVALRLDTSREQPQPQLPEPLSYQDIARNVNTKTVPSVNRNTSAPSAEKPVSEAVVPRPETEPSGTTTENSASAPEPINLKVPFQSQAPFGIWELPYKEACEEASAIMVDHFIQGKTLTAATMDAEILRFVKWQTENGYHIDVSTVELAEIVPKYYGYQTLIINNPTVESIVEQLKLGRPVILPLRGQEIGNPYYTQPGPPYHMLVIKGMTADGRFITNDPGTKRGADYLYDADVLLDAISDWSESEDGFPHGPRRAIVIYTK